MRCSEAKQRAVKGKIRRKKDGKKKNRKDHTENQKNKIKIKREENRYEKLDMATENRGNRRKKTDNRGDRRKNIDNRSPNK